MCWVVYGWSSVVSEKEILKTINELCTHLRYDGVEFMIAVIRAGIEENPDAVGLARRVIHGHYVDMPPEVFILSLQAHINTYRDQVINIISPVARDVENQADVWLTIDYIMKHELKEAPLRPRTGSGFSGPEGPPGIGGFR